jgi:hypothetical protein
MTNPTKVCPLTDEQRERAREAWDKACRAYGVPPYKFYVMEAVYAAGLRDAAPAEAAQGEVEELRHALRLAQDAMRAPLDDWKGELERKALDAARRALAPKAAP